MFQDQNEMFVRHEVADMIQGVALLPNKIQITKYLDDHTMIVLYKDIRGRLTARARSGTDRRWTGTIKIES